MQDIERHPADFFAVLIGDEDREVTALKLGALLQEPPGNFLGDIQSLDVIRQLGAPFVSYGLRIHQIKMIARHVILESVAETPDLEPSFRDGSIWTCGTLRNLQITGTLLLEIVGTGLTMLDELRVLAQPGAAIAVLAVLLLMAAGDAAIFIAAKGWPF